MTADLLDLRACKDSLDLKAPLVSLVRRANAAFPEPRESKETLALSAILASRVLLAFKVWSVLKELVVNLATRETKD